MPATSLQTGDAADSEFSDIRAVVSQVYESVWEDFSIWDQDHCQKTLQSLSRPVRIHLSPLPTSYESSSKELPTQRDAPSIVAESFDDWDIVNGSMSTLYVTDVQEISETQVLRPPSYEACTPISRNLMVGDDSDFLPFIPNADDPNYDYTYDIGEHKFFAWHQPNRDPDLEVINIETIRSLLQDHGMTEEDIDRSDIFPLTVEQIIKSARRRDMPKWRSHGPSANLSQIVTRTADGPKEILDYFLSTFCNNFNCMTGYCTTHLVDTHLPNVVPPKIPYSKMHEAIKEPCGLECFLQAAASSSNIASFWTQRDNETLFTILDYSPDTLPCDLAIICRKPCREVHKQRALYHGPPQMEKGKQTGHGSFEIDHANMTVHVVLDPTVHASSTRPIVGILVVVPRLVYEDGKVVLVPKLKKYAGRRNVLVSERTSNVIPRYAFRVVQNELSNHCKNSSIRRGEFKTTHVRQSTWGLGLFMSEPCQKGDLISEYVGELIFEPTFHSRDGIAVHKGRSYAFELNSTFSLDSGSAGNETRYINHSPTPNCSSTIMLVNGEHRIGIYASTKILKDEELFIDYGPKFFPNKKESQEEPIALPTYCLEHASDATYSNNSRDEDSALD